MEGVVYIYLCVVCRVPRSQIGWMMKSQEEKKLLCHVNECLIVSGV